MGKTAACCAVVPRGYRVANMPQAETSPRIRAEGSHPSCGTNCAKRVLKCEKLSFFVDRTLKAGERTQRGRQYAAVVQRQYTSLPNWERGFDSRLWLHMGANACPCRSEGPGRTRLLPNLRDPHGSCAGSCGPKPGAAPARGMPHP